MQDGGENKQDDDDSEVMSQSSHESDDILWDGIRRRPMPEHPRNRRTNKNETAQQMATATIAQQLAAPTVQIPAAFNMPAAPNNFIQLPKIKSKLMMDVENAERKFEIEKQMARFKEDRDAAHQKVIQEKKKTQQKERIKVGITVRLD